MQDKQDITELLARYADAVNRGDIEAWSDLWVEDCLYTLDSNLILKGRESVVSLYKKSMGYHEYMYQLIHSGMIDLNKDTASGRWYVSEYRGMKQEKLNFVIGAYQDRYVKTSEGWKFSERHFDQIYLETRSGETKGQYFPYPEFNV